MIKLRFRSPQSRNLSNYLPNKESYLSLNVRWQNWIFVFCYTAGRTIAWGTGTWSWGAATDWRFWKTDEEYTNFTLERNTWSRLIVYSSGHRVFFLSLKSTYWLGYLSTLKIFNSPFISFGFPFTVLMRKDTLGLSPSDLSASQRKNLLFIFRTKMIRYSVPGRERYRHKTCNE